MHVIYVWFIEWHLSLAQTIQPRLNSWHCTEVCIWCRLWTSDRRILKHRNEKGIFKMWYSMILQALPFWVVLKVLTASYARIASKKWMDVQTFLCFVDRASLYNLVNRTWCTIFLVCFFSLHVSGNYVPIIRRNNCTYATLGICHSVMTGT